MKKKLKKNLKRVIAGLLALTIIVKIIVPFVEVFAEDAYTIEFDFTDGTINGNVVTYTIGQVEVTATVNGTITEGIANLGNESWTTSITIDDNYDSDTMQIRVYATDGFQTTYSYDAGTLTRNGDGGLPDSLKFVIEEKSNNLNPGDEQGLGEGFDGRAVVLWSCGNGVCYHEFDVVDPETCDPENDIFEGCDPEIGDFDDGNSTFFRDTDVAADNKPGTTFDVNAEYKEWYLTDEFNTWQELYEIATGNQINWDTLDPELIMGEPNQNIAELAEEAAEVCADAEDQERCINLYAAQERGEIWTHELQPVGEPTEANAYVSYGDRNFKVVIYNENYRGITTTADFEGLNYYPSQWADPFLRTDQYDVSDTDEDSPKYLESILLEDTINIDVLPYNNYEIATIEALDVPADAITITKVNSRKFQVEFLSNFYDHVVFKLTDTNGDESYVQIKRYTIDAWIRDGNTLSADFYYDHDEEYDNFVITAKILYYDGTTENVTLEAVEGFRDELGNPVEGFVFDEQEAGGKGLKRSVFEYYIAEGADRLVKDVYLNVEYVDDNDQDTTYAGAYSGSGEGTPANLYHPGEGE